MATTLAAQVGAEIQWDHDSKGATWNHREAWQSLIDNGHEWSVVLEDDAQPTPAWTELDDRLSRAPSPLVCLYLGYGTRGADAQQHTRSTVAAYPDAEWYTGKYTFGAVGVAIRTDLIPHLLGRTKHMGSAWDDSLGVWCVNHLKERVAFTNPSLVEHADTESLLGHGKSARKAYRTTGEVCEGLVVPLW